MESFDGFFPLPRKYVSYIFYIFKLYFLPIFDFSPLAKLVVYKE